MKIDAKQRLAVLVKQLRGDKSYRAYGRILGVAGTTVQGWENMTSEPEMGNLSQIAKLAGYTLQELMDYLNGKPVQDDIPVERIVRQIKEMPAKQLALIGRAISDRFESIAE
jgi:transcriptional regulator with XRE-family HTH domain